MKLIAASALTLLLTTVSAFADPPIYLSAYLTCIDKVMKQEQLSEFIVMTPEEQANKCLNILHNYHPDIAQKIDSETFRQGVLDGRYTKEH